MIDPPIERVLDKTESRFTLVVLASRRARQINAYFNQLGDGIGSYVPPQVHSLSRKPLSIALEEIAEDKVVVELVE
jgi:DNA-directed RNA polymerase subunit omega